MRRVSTLRWRRKRSRQQAFREGNRYGIRTSVRTFTISGGIDLSIDARHLDGGAAVHRFFETVRRELNSGHGPFFRFNDGSKNWAGLVLPVNQAGRDAWSGNEMLQAEPTMTTRYGWNVDPNGMLTVGYDLNHNGRPYAA